jgi:hypothetical protein
MLNVRCFPIPPRAGGQRSAELCQMALPLCHCGAFGATFRGLQNGLKLNLVICLQCFHAVFEIAAPLLHWNREQTTNFL